MGTASRAARRMVAEGKKERQRATGSGRGRARLEEACAVASRAKGQQLHREPTGKRENGMEGDNRCPRDTDARHIAD